MLFSFNTILLPGLLSAVIICIHAASITHQRELNNPTTGQMLEPRADIIQTVSTSTIPSVRPSIGPSPQRKPIITYVQPVQVNPGMSESQRNAIICVNVILGVFFILLAIIAIIEGCSKE